MTMHNSEEAPLPCMAAPPEWYQSAHSGRILHRTLFFGIQLRTESGQTCWEQMWAIGEYIMLCEEANRLYNNSPSHHAIKHEISD